MVDYTAHPKGLIQPSSREICTCSMLTVTLLLLYRKVIPLRFLSSAFFPFQTLSSSK